MLSITEEWLTCYEQCKRNGENPAKSIFWRLAAEILPLGVDPKDTRVQAVIAEIRGKLRELREAQGAGGTYSG